MKYCSGCKLSHDESEFHKCKSMADGLQIQCKKCRRGYQSSYRKTPAGKSVMRNWNASDGAARAYIKYSKSKPKVRKAHQVVKSEVRSGRMVAMPCEECGAKNTVAHHNDYAYPLVVRWLCSKCHTAWHKENGEGLNG